MFTNQKNNKLTMKQGYTTKQTQHKHLHDHAGKRETKKQEAFKNKY